MSQFIGTRLTDKALRHVIGEIDPKIVGEGCGIRTRVIGQNLIELHLFGPFPSSLRS